MNRREMLLGTGAAAVAAALPKATVAAVAAPVALTGTSVIRVVVRYIPAWGGAGTATLWLPIKIVDISGSEPLPGLQAPG